MLERQQFHVLYRNFLRRMIDLEILSAHGDVQKLLGQFGALLAAASAARHRLPATPWLPG